MTFEAVLRLLPYLVAALGLVLSLVAATHVILWKREPRAAVSWVGFILLFPFLGALLYSLFGINRVQRLGKKLRRRRVRWDRERSSLVCTPDELCSALTPRCAHLAPVARVAGELTGRDLLEGNVIEPLVNGEQAYPAMLREIDGAKRSVSLLAYIFEPDPLGARFVEALARAKARGCEVRVLVDDVGSPRGVMEALAAAGLRSEAFLPVVISMRRTFNLRNHRKILVVDGRTGFTGGMNLRESHLVETPGPHHEQDVHFRLEGPVVEHLQETFADDWAFTTGEVLRGDAWFPPIQGCGPASARGIPFDPGETRDTLRLAIVAALSAAHRSVRIVTPYFLPDPALISTLNVAALRGVEVDILLPQVNDNRVVQWASTAMLWQVLIGGCRVWMTPPPFDHSKLLVVDDAWALFGSANLDTRSLRLNFEFNVECYDLDLAGRLGRLIEGKRRAARPVTLKDVDGRPFLVRLRDGLARLFSPYL